MPKRADGPGKSFHPQEISTGSCWIDAKTGVRVDTGPGGWLPGGGAIAGGSINNPDANHVENSNSGRTFVKLPDGSWIDSKTGDPVATGPGGWLPGGGAIAGGSINNPDANHVENSNSGRTFVRIPCPPPATTPPPTRTPTYSGLHASVGVLLGAVGRNGTYDDGFKAGGTSGMAGINITVTVPVTHSIFVGGQLESLFPFQSSVTGTAETKLSTTGLYQAIVGTTLPAPLHPVDLWIGAGGAVAALQSGFTSATFHYSDTEVAKGYAYSVGASDPIFQHMRIVAQVNAIVLSKTQFGSPGGTYDYDQI
ncbi:MAG TPA: hypothetical protein VGU23_06010, partial [Acidobacteriaceae bacterium]|nr:hypothetical protein [Acidobacteriaceae bacterium]